MIELTKFVARIIFGFCLAISLYACAITQTGFPVSKSVSDQSKIIVSADSDPQQIGWWYVVFRRELEEPVPFYYDALIAHRVFKPVIDEYSDELKLWRFHRRAVSDAGGHKFTFFFYTSRAIAANIYEKINSNPNVNSLLQNSDAFKIFFQDINGNKNTHIGAISDKSWSPEIQDAWPEFAMGVSKTWLLLVDSIGKNQTTSIDENASLNEMIDFYRKIHEKIDAMWEAQGGHAFFHHLNALFGYKELYIFERNLRRF